MRKWKILDAFVQVIRQLPLRISLTNTMINAERMKVAEIHHKISRASLMVARANSHESKARILRILKAYMDILNRIQSSPSIAS